MWHAATVAQAYPSEGHVVNIYKKWDYKCEKVWFLESHFDHTFINTQHNKLTFIQV